MVDERDTLITYASGERVEVAEYVDFLARSDLGSEYPRKDFEARIATLLRNTDICITARAPAHLLVGVCLGLTDFAYFLYLTDLGVDRAFVRRGIAGTLVRMAHEQTGGPDDICMITWANRDAMPFYASCGMSRVEWAVGKHASDWQLFTVGADTGA